MCGIVGVIQYESEIPRAIRHRALRILFSELMLKTESRGRDATGLYQVMADGDWMMTKKAQKVTDWVNMERDDPKCEDPYVYDEIMESWLDHPEELSAVIGHCRAKTVGSTSNENNHPFAIQLDKRNALLGVHNGTLYNHEVLFDRMPDVVERQGTVDSEAIFHFLYYTTEHGTKPITAEAIKHIGKRLDGSFACIAVNSRFPNKIATFRDGRPLEFFMVGPLNIVIVASERRIIQSAIEKYEFIRRFGSDPTLPPLPPLHTEDRILLDRDFRIFDTNKKFPTGKFTFQAFDKISEQGEIRAFSTDIKEDWKDPKSVNPGKKSTYYPNGGYTRGAKNTTGTGPYSPIGAGTNAGAKTTKPFSSLNSVKALPAKAGGGTRTGDGDDAGILVEMEIGGKAEAEKGYEKAASLGVCSSYDKTEEVAAVIGKTLAEVQKMDAVEVANLIGKTHFNLGYATSRIDTKNEINSIRSKSRELTSKLERSQEKKTRAQNHLWEHRAVIQVLLALNKDSYDFTSDNVERVIDSFPGLNEQKRKDVVKAAKEVLDSNDTRNLIKSLSEKFREIEKKKAEKQQRDRQEQYRVN